MKYEFQVGDRVAAIVNKPQGNPFLHIGSTGTVVGIADWMSNLALVRWDNGDKRWFHDCDGLCDYGHGWNVMFEEIELIVENSQDFDISSDEIFSLLGGFV